MIFNVQVIIDETETVEVNVEATDAIAALVAIRDDLNENLGGEGDTFIVNEIRVKPG